MDCRTGEIHEVTEESARNLNQEIKDHLVMIPPEEVSQVKRMSKPVRKNWMRNKPCICGSNKKFKKCCWHKFR